MYALRTLFNTAIIGSSAILWLFLSGLAAGPFLWLFPGEKGRNVRKFVYFQSRGILFFVRLCSCGFKVSRAPRPQGPCIVAANHASSLDLYCVAALGFDNVVYVTKGWVFRLPFFRFVMHAAGYLDAEKRRPKKCWRAVKRRWKTGATLCFFRRGRARIRRRGLKAGRFIWPK